MYRETANTNTKPRLNLLAGLYPSPCIVKEGPKPDRGRDDANRIASICSMDPASAQESRSKKGLDKVVGVQQESECGQGSEKVGCGSPATGGIPGSSLPQCMSLSQPVCAGSTNEDPQALCDSLERNTDVKSDCNDSWMALRRI